MNAPDIKTPLPGPKAKAIIDRDAAVRVAVLHARLSARHRARRRRGRRGRRRQRLPRLRGRHRRQLHRRTRIPTSSRRSPSRRRSSCTCRAPTSTTSRRCGSPRSSPRSRRSTGGVRSFFGNSGTEAIEAALKLARYAHEAARTSSRSSARSTAARMGSLSLTASKVDPAARLRAADARRVSRAVSRLLSLSGRHAPTRARPSALDFIEHQIFVHLVVARRSRGDRRRADPGRRRLRRAADGVPAAAARADDAARHPARRSTKCSRAWAARERCSRSSTSASSRTSSRSPRASRRGCRSASPCARAERDGVAARRAREHVRRQSGVVRGGARDDQAAASERSWRTRPTSART